MYHNVLPCITRSHPKSSHLQSRFLCFDYVETVRPSLLCELVTMSGKARQTKLSGARAASVVPLRPAASGSKASSTQPSLNSWVNLPATKQDLQVEQERKKRQAEQERLRDKQRADEIRASQKASKRKRETETKRAAWDTDDETDTEAPLPPAKRHKPSDFGKAAASTIRARSTSLDPPARSTFLRPAPAQTNAALSRANSVAKLPEVHDEPLAYAGFEYSQPCSYLERTKPYFNNFAAALSRATSRDFLLDESNAKPAIPALPPQQLPPAEPARRPAQPTIVEEEDDDATQDEDEEAPIPARPPSHPAWSAVSRESTDAEIERHLVVQLAPSSDAVEDAVHAVAMAEGYGAADDSGLGDMSSSPCKETGSLVSI